VGGLHGLVRRSRRGPRAGHRHKDSAGTWEARLLPFVSLAWGQPMNNAPGPRSASDRGERKQAHGRVTPSEGNEARREGKTGVGASHSTEESGEPPRGDPPEGRGRLVRNRWRDTWRGRRTSLPCPRNAHGARRGAYPSLDEPYALIGHVRICGRPGAEAPGRPSGLEAVGSV
jgi:hypothetical protein